VVSKATAEIDLGLGAIDGLDNILRQTNYTYSGAHLTSIFCRI
jgi:hypothetical protein